MQMDTWADDPAATLCKVTEYDPLTSRTPLPFRYAEGGRDGRIYLVGGNGQESYYHVLERPNEPCHRAWPVHEGMPLFGHPEIHIPYHPNYRLGPLEGSPCDTLGVAVPPYILGHPYPSVACPGGTAHFEASAFGTGLAHRWQVSTDGGGSWEDLSDGPHFEGTQTNYLRLKELPLSFGGHLFRCTVTGNAGSAVSRPAPLTFVAEAPSAAISHSQDRDSVAFQSLSTGHEVLKWHFGDGDYSVLQHPVHFYQAAGEYAVSLTTENACGADTAYLTVTVPPLAADFHADRTWGCAPLKVTFRADVARRGTLQRFLTPGSSQPVAWANGWPHTVTYNTPGTYDVTLQVFTPGAVESDTLVRHAFITVTAGNYPSVEAVAAPAGDGYLLTCPGCTADAYTWDTGTGELLEGAPVQFDPPGPGLYTVVLEAASGCGPVFDALQLLHGLPEAAFEALPATGCSPQAVQYQVVQPFHGAEYRWTFPGGSPALGLGPSPVVHYGAPGVYGAALVVKAGDMAADTLVVPAAVDLAADACPAPQLFLQADGPVLTAWTDCQDALDWQWDMGDGTVLSGNPVTHGYGAAGDYVLRLALKDRCRTDTLGTAVAIVMTSATPGRPLGGRRYAVHPNPASSIVHLATDRPLETAGRFELFGTFGVRAASYDLPAGSTQASFSLDGLPPGLYFFKIFSEGHCLQGGKLVVVGR